jgi:hypothetical protein
MVNPKRLAAVTAAYTGYLVGEFDEMHKYIEEVMGHPVWTHEMASKEIMGEVREAAKEEFIALWKEFLDVSTSGD